jgi:hypothetical protein
MKPVLIAALALLVSSSPAVRQSTKPSETQIAIDKLRAAMSAPLEELTLLAAEDKKLARSDEDQSATGKMLERLKTKIQSADQPALKAKFELLQQKIEAYFADGCPEFSRTVPQALYDKCNPRRILLNSERESLIAQDKALKAQLADIAATQQAVTDTTLSNFEKAKANGARREDLEKVQAAQAAQLRPPRFRIRKNPCAATRSSSTKRTPPTAVCRSSSVPLKRPAFSAARS